MDKEEFRAKQEEINRLVDQKDYAGAMAVVDTIDWRRVKSGRTLSIVAEIYAANKRYEDSIDMYLLAYNRSRVGTNILSRLIEISLKAGNIEEAEEFYEEFRDVAPNNHASYVLKYKILKAKQAPIEQQIAVLDEYKEKEFTERWAYELALLYYKSEKKEECLDLCDTLILWFSEGPYVLKALDLKERLGVLEGSQKEQYEKAFTRALLTSEDREMLGEEAECEGKELQVTQQEDSEAEAQYDFEEEKQITEHSKESTSVETSLEDEISEELDSGELQEQKKNTPKGFQERLTKGFQDIFGKRDRETEKEDLFADDLLEEDLSQETLNVMHHDDVEEQNIPMLEPENLTGEEEPEFVDVESEQVRVEEGELRKPEEKSLFDSDVIQQIMEEKKQNQENATTTADGFGQNADDNSVFNLEEMILAAAFAQGIDLGKKTEEKVEEEFVPDLEEESELLEKPLIVSEKVQTTSEEAKPHQNPIGRLLKSAEQQLLIHIDAENEVQVLDEKTEKEVPATLPASEEMVLTEEQQKIDFAIDIQEEENAAMRCGQIGIKFVLNVLLR